MVSTAHGKTEEVPLKRREGALFRSGPPLGLILSTLPVLIGIVLQLRAVAALNVPGNILTGSYVVVMVLTALVCRAGAHLYRHIRPGLAVVYFFGTAAATLVALAALLVVTWPQSGWQHQAPMLMLVPIAYLVAARLYRGQTAEHPLVWVAHSATGLMLFISSFSALAHLLEPRAARRQTGRNCWRCFSPRRPCSTSWPRRCTATPAAFTWPRPWGAPRWACCSVPGACPSSITRWPLPSLACCCWSAIAWP